MAAPLIEHPSSPDAGGRSVLEGIRVVDVSTGPVAGMATMVLADFGADVIKVEPPSGDRFRSIASAPLWLRGKRSFVADLESDDGISDLQSLLATADVLVVGGPPSRARRWRLDREHATATNPELVHCSITGWGPAGPMAEVPGYEGAVAARGGRMLAFERQLRRGGPVFAAVPIAGHAAAFGAVQGILAALVARSRGGGAQVVETSLLQGLLPYDLTELLVVELAERQGAKLADISATGGDLPTLNYHPVHTKDGRWIQCGNLLEHLLYSFLDAVGLLGDIVTDPRFAGSPATWDAEAVEAARDMILLRLEEKTADEWMDIFRADGNVAAEPYLTTAEALHHPAIAENGDVITLERPDQGTFRTVGPIAILSKTPAVIGRRAPRLGEHTDELRSELQAGRPPSRPSGGAGTSSGERSTSDGPLQGVTVVEFSTIIAAPLSTAMLADLGARVIKVEPIGGDPYRYLAEAGTPGAKTTAGKESICIDLKKPDGLRIARALCQRADVVVHNARPGVAERLGLGEEDLRSENPRLIWVSLTGYGVRSRSANRPATHPCAGAATGGAAYQAGQALRYPCADLKDVREIARQLIRANEPSPDPNTAVVAAASILMALVARERLGIGQAAYINMMAANLYANADDALEYEGKLPRSTCDPDLHGLSAGYRLYRCADGWLFLALTKDEEWLRCAEIVGLNWLIDDPRFASAPARAANDDALQEILCGALRERSAAEWEQRFVSAGVAGVRADVATPGNCFAHDQQVLANGFTPECSHTRFGKHRRWGPLVRVNGGLGAYKAGVLAGEQTDQILVELGYRKEEVASLRAEGVVTSESESA
jgi:crotonobetainyl-CoA:carnitine CoA-transferase CaiB-like acyl-CoA transferase